MVYFMVCLVWLRMRTVADVVVSIVLGDVPWELRQHDNPGIAVRYKVRAHTNMNVGSLMRVPQMLITSVHLPHAGS